MEIVYAPKAYLGFESPSLRHLLTASPGGSGDFLYKRVTHAGHPKRVTIAYGGMAEWLNAAVSKTVLPVIQVTRVRIPLPPPEHQRRCSDAAPFLYPALLNKNAQRVTFYWRAEQKQPAGGIFPAHEGVDSPVSVTRCAFLFIFDLYKRSLCHPLHVFVQSFERQKP